MVADESHRSSCEFFKSSFKRTHATSYPLPQSRTLLDTGIFEALRACLYVYGHLRFITNTEISAEGAHSRVDYVTVLVVDGNEEVALCEAKSPSVMRHVGQLILAHGFQLTWRRGQALIQKVFTKVSTPSLSIITWLLKRYRFEFRSETEGMAVSELP